jgi:hypothetical protein
VTLGFFDRPDVIHDVDGGHLHGYLPVACRQDFANRIDLLPVPMLIQPRGRTCLRPQEMLFPAAVPHPAQLQSRPDVLAF